MRGFLFRDSDYFWDSVGGSAKIQINFAFE